MNNAKEKAQELIDKFYNELYTQGPMRTRIAKNCALICCDEILAASTIKLPEHNIGKIVYIDDFWNEVKTEIKNL